MGYIFDAMNRQQPRDDDPPATGPARDVRDQLRADATSPGPDHTPPKPTGRAPAQTPRKAPHKAAGKAEKLTAKPPAATPPDTETAAETVSETVVETGAQTSAQISAQIDAQAVPDVAAPEADDLGIASAPLRLADLVTATDPVPPTGTVAADTRHPAYTQTDVGTIDDRLVALTDRVSVIAEEYRGIRTSLLARWEHRRHLAHLITSATPQEGKTITSLNLGLSMAELHNRRTIVVECDLRLPQFARLLNLPDSPGLIGCIEGDAKLDDVIHAVGDNSLHVIPAGGRANERAVQLLSSARMSDLLAELRRRYDHVIIDTPPVVDLADAGILGALSDDVLLIVRMHTTPRGLVEQAVRTLASYHAPVTHMIATNQTDVGSGYYASHYGGYRYRHAYRYRYGAEGAAKAA
jgi:capsular exopolysaccharide synthesis family protein